MKEIGIILAWTWMLIGAFLLTGAYYPLIDFWAFYIWSNGIPIISGLTIGILLFITTLITKKELLFSKIGKYISSLLFISLGLFFLIPIFPMTCITIWLRWIFLFLGFNCLVNLGFLILFRPKTSRGWILKLIELAQEQYEKKKE